MAVIDLQRFIGVWKLISVETRDEKGELFRRGQRTGYLLYSEEGYMSVAFMKEGRPTFASGEARLRRRRLPSRATSPTADDLKSKGIRSSITSRSACSPTGSV